MKPGRMAVICSGHARDVYQSWQINSGLLAAHHGVQSWHFYSYLWTASSDPRPHEVTDQDRHILAQLKHRHVQTTQQDVIYHCFRRFLDADVFLIRDILLDQELFSRFMGQILGFIMALDHWRQELSHYDWIVRSRWDMILDRQVIDKLSSDLEQGPGRTFYNKSICMFNGQGSISGDVIYSDAASWLELIPSTDAALDRIIGQCLRQREIFQGRYRRPFYLDGYWFNSHSLWYMLFQDQPFDMMAKGESFRASNWQQAVNAEIQAVDAQASSLIPNPVEANTYRAQRHERNQRLRKQAEDQILRDQTASEPPRLFKN